ncbi:MAG: SCP2 sterol-binding domain-containing protein, partial [Thermoanaerobaculia bacterium]
MSLEVFTEPWVQRWAEELKASADYRQAAAKWEGSLVIEMAADHDLGIAEDRGAFLDLWHGECRAARIAGSGDRDGADYVIRASADIWRRILDGELEPLLGLMSGQLELTRGSLLRLTPHAKASRELVRAATRVESHFPIAGEKKAGATRALPAPETPALPAPGMPAHVEVFRRFLDEVAEEHGDLSRFHGPSYRGVFYEQLPQAMARLRHDPSPEAQAEASTTYNMIVEGVLAETGYHAYHAILERHDLMPGMRRAMAYLKSDEARHLAYGVYLLSRLVAEHGDGVWRRIEARMGKLLPMAIDLIHEMFDAYDEMPFGLKVEEFTEFAMSQFRRR